MTPHLPRRAMLGLLRALPLAALPGCAIPERAPPVPRGQAVRASVLGLPNERFRLGTPEGAALYAGEYVAAVQRQRARLGLREGAPVPQLDLLAISGGGENGAFGAGLLNGWTARGDRPVFDLVTGVSTGALTAPFAFLGPAWDEPLRRVYTDITIADVARSRWFTAALFDDGLADSEPLFATISRYLDEAMLVAIARGYAEGRLLLIGTTDLDAQLPVIWNVGAIAASGHPRALETVRRVLLASAAIPGAFPPVMFDVTLDGRAHQEMHVDGGAFAQAFLYPREATALRRQALSRREAVSPATAWIIRNARLDAEWAAVDRRTVSIAGRAISTMIGSSGYNDLLRMWYRSREDGIGYRLAFIGPEFTGEYTTPFEQGYMRALFAHGFEQARAGYPWRDAPPV